MNCQALLSHLRRTFASIVVLVALFCVVVIAFPGARAAQASFQSGVVEVNDNGLVFLLPSGNVETVSDFLLEHGITLSEHDTLYPALSDPITPGTIITIERAKHVTIVDYISGERRDRELSTHGATVLEALREANVELADEDFVEPSLTASLHSHLRIDITRVERDSYIKRSEIPYETIETNDSNLEKGKLVVDEKGESGELVREYGTEYNNGALTRTRLLNEYVAREPKDRRVRRGTKILVTDRQGGKASWYGAPSMSAAHRTYPFGSRVRVTNSNNGQSVVVTITDRGPFIDGRVIDLSRDAFEQIASLGSGTVSVSLELLAP